MPRIKLIKSTIDSLRTPNSDVVYWDAGVPGFGVKVTPKGRKVFVVLYRTGGAGSKLRKYTIGPYGRATLHQARVGAQKGFAARLAGGDPRAPEDGPRRGPVAAEVGRRVGAHASPPPGRERREEVAQMTWDELDLGQHIWTLPKSRTKNGKQHVVHLSEQATAVLDRVQKNGPFVFSILGRRPFHDFSKAKRMLDQLSAVSH